jgi:hypothetical protein
MIGATIIATLILLSLCERFVPGREQDRPALR